MHELSICQALLDQVENIASTHQATEVVDITVEIGALSGVVPELLHRAFEVARIGTVAAGAHLILKATPVIVRCSACEQEHLVDTNSLRCPNCEHWQTSVISGDELILRDVDLRCPPLSEIGSTAHV